VAWGFREVGGLRVKELEGMDGMDGMFCEQGGDDVRAEA
jgi:hypothetical protein